MSSYFVNSLSTCYGQTVGLESCSEGNFHRNGTFQHSGGIYPGFPGSRYPFSAKDERSDDHNGDYYATQRLSHMPHSSPCSSPHNLHGGTPNIPNVHHMHSTSERSCNIRTSSNSNSSYFPNGQLTNVDRNRSPPSQQPPPVSPLPQQPQTPHSPRPADQSYGGAPHIYPWMRRMQYSQGKTNIVFFKFLFYIHPPPFSCLLLSSICLVSLKMHSLVKVNELYIML